MWESISTGVRRLPTWCGVGWGAWGKIAIAREGNVAQRLGCRSAASPKPGSQQTDRSQHNIHTYEMGSLLR